MMQQPAVPASTVTYLNQSGQTAQVTITGGTVTSVNVNGTQVATATDFTATVPAGQAIAVTYSVVPAWYWSALTPAVPASGTAVANTAGQDISIVIAGGTVTAVTVNGTSVATSSPANVMLPAGESVTLTYSAAPVWAWMAFLDMSGMTSTGTVYAGSNTGTGYSEDGSLPYAVHPATGEGGFGAGVSN